MKPKRIQLSRRKGFRLPANTVVVSRPSRFGNPWRIAVVMKRLDCDEPTAQAACVRAFAEYLEDKNQASFVAEIKRELAGKNLACWCKPGTPCHADVLLKVANDPEIIKNATCDGCGAKNTFVQVITKGPFVNVCLCRGCLESKPKMRRSAETPLRK